MGLLWFNDVKNVWTLQTKITNFVFGSFNENKEIT